MTIDPEITTRYNIRCAACGNELELDNVDPSINVEGEVELQLLLQPCTTCLNEATPPVVTLYEENDNAQA